MAKKRAMEVTTITHPGFILGMEIRARGFTQKSFAEQIALQQSHLSEIIKGKRGISGQLAVKLEETLGIPADHWNQMQAKYDYEQKAVNLHNVAERDAESMLIAYNEIYDMRIIYKSVGLTGKPSSERLAFCKEQLRFGTPAVQQKQVQGYFHRSEKTGLDTRMIATWAELAKYEASRRPLPTGKFDKVKMDELAKELSFVFCENHNTINRVEKLLNDYGIRFCVVPKIERASIDGYSFFIKGKPAIVVTKRYNRIDNLAFAVLHEVGHLKLHSSENYNGNINLAYAEEELNTKEEQEANAFAAEALIPECLWADAPVVSLNPIEIQQKYSKWAKEKHLNKWIVLGRIFYLTGIYMFKSDKTREIN